MSDSIHTTTDSADGYCVCDDGRPARDCGIAAHRAAARSTVTPKPVTPEAIRSHLRAAAEFSNNIAAIDNTFSPWLAYWSMRASLELEWARTLAEVMKAETL